MNVIALSLIRSDISTWKKREKARGYALIAVKKGNWLNLVQINQMPRFYLT